MFCSVSPEAINSSLVLQFPSFLILLRFSVDALKVAAFFSLSFCILLVSQDHLDVSGPPYNEPHLGCALLREKVDEQPPKIHVFGHIHGGYGYKFHNGTHFFNASILNERYEYVNKPITFDWDPETNEITFI